MISSWSVANGVSLSVRQTAWSTAVTRYGYSVSNQLVSITVLEISTGWAKKVGPQTLGHNSVKSEPINFFSLEDSWVNL